MPLDERVRALELAVMKLEQWHAQQEETQREVRRLARTVAAGVMVWMVIQGLTFSYREFSLAHTVRESVQQSVQQTVPGAVQKGIRHCLNDVNGCAGR